MAGYVTRAGLRMRVGGALWRWWQQNRGRIHGEPHPVQLPRLVRALSPNQSFRHGAPISLVVIHDTEGSYAGAVNWLRNPDAQASAHIVLREDGREATQLVGWQAKAWTCADFNPQSLNLEMAGTASKGFPEVELAAAAAITAYWCRLFDIPVRYSAGGRKPGITFHQDLGAAGGGHSDPGFNLAQKLLFVHRVKQALRRGVTPQTWGQ